ncbi:MAG: (2Fe-2S)-binding protein [Streptosporangiaceae bacterium]
MDTPSAGPRALAAAAKAGPYFTIQAWSGEAGWQPLRALLSDPAVLAARVGHTRRGLARHAGCAAAAVEPRVAASVLFLGLAAQLVSPLLGAAVLASVVPRLTAADLYWQPARGGPWPLAARPVDGVRTDGLTAGETAGQLADRMQQLTGPLASTVGLTFQLSGQVLRGNVASALAGASATLAATFPARAARATELAAGVLAREPLRGSGEFGPAGRFRRRSCCLLYRVPGAGMCGDCILAVR